LPGDGGLRRAHARAGGDAVQAHAVGASAPQARNLRTLRPRSCRSNSSLDPSGPRRIMSSDGSTPFPHRQRCGASRPPPRPRHRIARIYLDRVELLMRLRTNLALAMLFTLATPAVPARADLIPPGGWAAVKLTDGLQLAGAAIVIDPVTHDLLIGDHAATPTIWRVTSSGARTLFLPGSELGLGLAGFALDPLARV